MEPVFRSVSVVTVAVVTVVLIASDVISGGPKMGEERSLTSCTQHVY